ncbi:uncharacterized protein [Parasteatoda tepidariorum]|uniref:uncharacterized protein n=1 Tax=Parasteatoda tepidariorum TaxID=114398 RepID=UPI00077F9548|nr:uncharacterized protein LOC107454019 [Parasteatoda tepidariorum]
MKIKRVTYLRFTLIICFVGIAACGTIEVPECNPPDYPAGGGYGPRQDYYMTGDIIHYYCDSHSHIGGNFYRRCEDNGDWIGDTPVCDFPMDMPLVNQTSTAEPKEENDALFASDGDRATCSSTAAGHGEYWMGTFKEPGELIRIMAFIPRGEVAYDVILVKSDGQELSCGQRRDKNARLEWSYHNCPGPNNRDAVGVKIKSLSSNPLKICEITAHVLTSPTCVDPHLHILDGRIELTRKRAVLVCNAGFTRSRENKVECVRDGVWKRKRLICLEEGWDGGLRQQNTFDNEI